MGRRPWAVLGLIVARLALAQAAAACDLAAVFEAPAAARLPAGQPVEWQIGLRNVGSLPCPPGSVELLREGSGAVGRQALPALPPRAGATLRILERDPPAGTHTYSLGIATPVPDTNPRNNTLAKTVSFESAPQARAKPAPALIAPTPRAGDVPRSPAATGSPPEPGAPTTAPAALPAQPPPADARAQAKSPALSPGRCDLEARIVAPKGPRLAGRAPIAWTLRFRNTGSAICPATEIELQRAGASGTATPVGARARLGALEPGKSQELVIAEGEPPAEGNHTYTVARASALPGDTMRPIQAIPRSVRFTAPPPPVTRPEPSAAAAPPPEPVPAQEPTPAPEPAPAPAPERERTSGGATRADAPRLPGGAPSPAQSAFGAPTPALGRISRVEPRSVFLLRGGPALTVSLEGSALDAARVASVEPDGAGVTAELATGATPTRELTLRASAGATEGSDWKIRVSDGVSQADVPLALQVGDLFVEVPCGGTAHAIRGVGTERTQLGQLKLPYQNPLRIDLCTTPGLVGYDWSRECIGSGELQTSFGKSGSGPRATMIVTDYVRDLPSSVFDGVFSNSLCATLTVALPGRVPVRHVAEFSFPIRVDGLPESPSIEKVWIDDYRPGRTSGTRENLGVLDPVLLAQPEAWDGELYVKGKNLAASGTRFTLGANDTELERIESSKSGASDVVKLRARDFRSGPLEAHGEGGRARSKPLKRLGYRVADLDLIASRIASLRIVLGNPIGEGEATLGEVKEALELGSMVGAGGKLDISNLTSREPRASVKDAKTEAVVEIEIPFETNGPELVGTWLEEISYWTCDEFKIRVSGCKSNNPAVCLAEILGQAASGTCLNPANWKVKKETGPALPLAVEISSPKATLRTSIAARDGRPKNVGASLTFTASALSASVGILPLPIDVVRQYTLDETNEQLALSAPALGDAVADALWSYVRALDSQARVTGVSGTAGSGIFFDIEHP